MHAANWNCRKRDDRKSCIRLNICVSRFGGLLNKILNKQKTGTEKKDGLEVELQKRLPSWNLLEFPINCVFQRNASEISKRSMCCRRRLFIIINIWTENIDAKYIKCKGRTVLNIQILFLNCIVWFVVVKKYTTSYLTSKHHQEFTATLATLRGFA